MFSKSRGVQQQKSYGTSRCALELINEFECLREYGEMVVTERPDPVLFRQRLRRTEKSKGLAHAMLQGERKPSSDLRRFTAVTKLESLQL